MAGVRESDYDEELTILFVRVGVNDLKILNVVIWIRSEREFDSKCFFHPNQ